MRDRRGGQRPSFFQFRGEPLAEPVAALDRAGAVGRGSPTRVECDEDAAGHQSRHDDDDCDSESERKRSERGAAGASRHLGVSLISRRTHC